MNGLLLLGIAAVLFICAYVFYGRYLVKTWGIDVNADTPAKTYEDGEDFVPSNKWKVFAHQFSSIAGAGPVTGPVMALMFGWFQLYCGLLSEEFSSELYMTLVLYMHLLNQKVNQWVKSLKTTSVKLVRNYSSYSAGYSH